MTHLTWLAAEQRPDFPPIEQALDDPQGLLAAGGDLTEPWLLTAYERGIFPWFSEGEPIMWWSPFPRMVLMPGTAHCSKSLRKAIRKLPELSVRTNQRFSEVIQYCANNPLREDGTWITEDMQWAYQNLHHDGWAHSIEVYQGDELIGGLYGVAIDRLFFGESMFSLAPNGSKIAFLALSQWAQTEQIKAIDCQLYNPHLDSLGAKIVDRKTFKQWLPRKRRPVPLGQEDWTPLLRGAAKLDKT